MIPALFAIASAVTALAVLSRVSGTDEWAIEPYAGVFRMDDGERNHDPFQRFDDQGNEASVGVRAFVPVAERWEAGLEYGYVGFESRLRDEPQDVFPTRSDIDMHLVLGQVRRSWPVGGLVLSAAVGAGAMTVDAGEFDSASSPGSLALADVGPPDPVRETEPLVALGIGVRRPLTSRFSAAAEARDLVHACGESSDSFLDASSLFCDREAWLHHLQLTAALRVEF